MIKHMLGCNILQNSESLAVRAKTDFARGEEPLIFFLISALLAGQGQGIEGSHK